MDDVGELCDDGGLYSAQVSADEFQLRQRERITDPALASLDGDELIAELVSRVEALLEADAISLMVIDGTGRYLEPVAVAGIDGGLRQGFRILVGTGFSGKVAQLRQPMVAEDVDPAGVLNPTLSRRGVRSLLGVPLIAGGRAIGVLAVGSRVVRKFSEIETSLLELAGDRIATELAATARRTEARTLRILQRSLLPSQLPEVEGLEFAERFVPGGLALVGGDWYDVFELPSGRLGIVIGDVVGRGLPAAVVMGRLRSVLRAYAFIEDDPAATLDRVDAKFNHFEPGQMATLGFAVVEPDLGSVVVATAGHPPPLLVEPGGEAQLVAVPAGAPIGSGLDGPRESVQVEFRPGATLMVYTDGLFERRRQPFDVSLERLRMALRAGPVEDAIGDVMATMIGTDGLDDDTAVLALRRHPDT